MARTNVSGTEQMDVPLDTIEHHVKGTALDHQPIESFVLVWLATDGEEINDMTKSCPIISDWRVFQDPDMCVEHIVNYRQQEVFLVVSSLEGEQIVSLVDQLDAINSIYVYSSDKPGHGVPWDRAYRKVRGVFMKIDSIFEQLWKDIRRHSNNQLSVSSISSLSRLTNVVDGEQLSFMYSQLIRDIFRTLRHPIDQPVHALREMILHFSEKYEKSGYRANWLEQITYPSGGTVNVVPSSNSLIKP